MKNLLAASWVISIAKINIFNLPKNREPKKVLY